MVKTLTASEMGKRKWALMGPEDRAKHVAKMKRATKRRWGALSAADRKEQMKKVRAGIKKKLSTVKAI